MDFVAPAIMFIIGFGGAMLVRRLLTASRFRRSRDLPVKSSVRLDRVARKKGKKRSRS
jgi:hypothetical protein